MGCRRRTSGWLGLAACLLFAVPARPAGLFRSSHPLPATVDVALEEMNEQDQARVRGVLDRPTLSARGNTETFHCQPEVYRWLLDHPDRAAHMWKRMGAVCADITDRGGGRFGWSDGQGSDLVWETVLRSPQQHVWYAEGVVRPGALLPLVTVRAVVVLHTTEGHDGAGRPAMRHWGEVVLHTDSRAAALATRLAGGSAPRMAEQYVAQVQTFFAALAWRLDRVPAKKEAE